MTDEEARAIVFRVLAVSLPDGMVLANCVKAGYRAAMTEAKNELIKHIFLRGNDQWKERNALTEFGDWLDEQVKKEDTP